MSACSNASLPGITPTDATAEAATTGQTPITCRPVSCPSGWLVDTGTVCSPPNMAGGPPSSCSSEGNGLCYLRCTSDADCQAVGLPACGSITLFDGSDEGFATPVCVGTTQLPACGAADAATDGALGG